MRSEGGGGPGKDGGLVECFRQRQQCREGPTVERGLACIRNGLNLGYGEKA